MKRIATIALLAALLPAAVLAQVPRPKPPGTTPTTVPGNNPAQGSMTGGTGTGLSDAPRDPMAEQVGGGKLRPDEVMQYMNTITAQDLEAHVRFLASDALQGRETGELGQKAAAEYIAAHFRRLGLTPPVRNGNQKSYFQTYPLLKTTFNGAHLSFGWKDSLHVLQDFIYISKLRTTVQLDAPLVYAGYGIDDPRHNNYNGLNVKDKAVVVLAGEPMNGKKSKLTGKEELSEWSEDWEKKADAAQAKGAKALIVVLREPQFAALSVNPWLQHNVKGVSLQLQPAEPSGIPIFYIRERVADLLFKPFRSNVTAQYVAQDAGPAVPAWDFKKTRCAITSDFKKEEIQAENVLGFLEGTDKKEEVVILTAHYDHLGVHDGEVYNGADDDGSGVAAVLELAEAFAQAAREGKRPRRSILFMPVSGEEKGLLGSEYYSEHPVFPLSNTVCDLNIDMIGRIDPEHPKPDYVYVIGSDKLSSELHTANENANKKYINLNLDYTYNAPDDPNQFYYRSDHYNFAKKNIPVIFYFTGVHEDYHKATDDVEKIMFDKMVPITRLIFATAWDVANRDEKLKVDRKNDFEPRD